MNRSVIQNFFILLLFIVLGASIYSNTLKAPFIFDDIPRIKENPYLRINALTIKNLVKACFNKKSSMSRPIGNLSFALNYYFHQYKLPGYHIVNIIIHTLAALFLYLFIKTTLNTPLLAAKYDHPNVIACCAALIWLVYPLHTQSVTYIIQRLNSMAAMFYVLSLWLYAKGRLIKANRNSWPWYSGSIIAGVLALGSKQNAAMLPFFILLYEWYFFQDLDRSWLTRHLKYVFGIVLLFGIIALIFLGTNPLERLKSITDFADNEFTLTERVLTQPRVVIYYLSLLAYPHPSRLNLDYDFPLSHSLVDPVTTVLALGVIIGLVCLAFCISKKECLLAFCILWFFGNLVIESSVIPLAIIYEHRTYLPSMLVCLLAVTLGYRLIKLKRLSVALLLAVVTAFSFWTYQRNKVWSNEITLWQDVVDKSPKKARPYNNLGIALVDQGRITEAIKYYAKALQLDPDNLEAHNNIGKALKSEGRIEEAVKHYSQALHITPDDPRTNYNLANALADNGLMDLAVIRYSKVLQIDPDYTEAHNNLANILSKQGRLDEAVKHYSEALRINPDYSQAHNNLGNILSKKGRTDEAIKHYSTALKINPDYAEARNNLGLALAESGKSDKAIYNYLAAIRLYPDYVEAYMNLAAEMSKQGKIDEAVHYYQKALSLRPELPEAIYHLAKLYIRRSEYEKALSLYHKMIAILPDNPAGYYNIACIYARQNRPQESVLWLKKAIAKGLDDWNHIKTDKDLDNIRNSDQYKAFIKGH